MAVPVHVVGGLDPHADTFHVAALTTVGKVIGDAEFPADATGYAAAVAFLNAAGVVDQVGVEGAAGYGAGITRAVAAAGIAVVEVERPTRSARRRVGKSDRLDAYHAARAVLADRSSPVKDPAIDGLRALHLARRSAVKARTAAANQLQAILIMAPEPVRARFRGLDTNHLVAAVLRCRGFYPDPVVAETVAALKVLAERHRDLGRQTAADRPDRPNRHRRQPRVAGRHRCRTRRGCPTADHRRPQSRPAQKRTVLRSLMRRRPGAGFIRQDPPLPALPRR